MTDTPADVTEEEKKCTHEHDPRAAMCRVCSNKMLKHATTAPAIERFWAKIEKQDEEWRWTGSIHQGYGKFRPDAGASPVLAHRYAYELLVGPIPEGFTLDHLCHTRDLSCRGGDECEHRRCCNPDHLEPITLVENILRGKRVRR